MKFRAFNPDIDKGKQLYEERTLEGTDDGDIALTMERVDVPFDEAVDIYWYYYVERESQ